MTNTQLLSPAALSDSVIAVPPLARNESLTIDHGENRKLIKYLEAGGVRTLLYGGNAVLGNIALSEYSELLSFLRDTVAPQTRVLPSVGPGFGTMMDQAAILTDFDFPSAMLLPTNDPTTPAGIGLAMTRFVDRLGRPAILYLKRDGAVDVDTVRGLMKDGMIASIKYAIVRSNTAEDPFLRALIDAIGSERIVSGMGEQPAIVHWRDFKLAGFTSGCVCVAPRLSMSMLRALSDRNFELAERIRGQFGRLESLRDSLSPVRVLHAAVKFAGICDTGPITPLLSAIEQVHEPAIAAAASELLELNRA